MTKQKIGWIMQGFVVFILLCALSVTLGLAIAWWASVAFVGGVILLAAYLALAIHLTEQDIERSNK